MPRVKIHPTAVVINASANDTYEWAHKPGARWPCSTLAGRRFFAAFDRNGLVDFAVDGGRGDQDVDGHELNAMCADFARGRVPAGHPCAEGF